MSEKLDRVDARARLKPRRDPYWQRISQGRFLGFRRMSAGARGTWLARFYDGERYSHKPLGDFGALQEKERFDAARAAAEEWFTHLDRGGVTSGRPTVRSACAAYVEEIRIQKGEAAAGDAAGRFGRLVYSDPLARVELQKLAPRHLADWKKRVLERGGTRGSYNRNSTALRAALNLSYKRREVASDHAWAEELKPFKGADGRRTLYLDRAKRRRLILAAGEAQAFCKSLALVPMRPNEVAALKVEHLNAAQRTLHVPAGKTGMRDIPLAEEAAAHFKECAKGKLPGAWLVARADGSQWKKEAWRDEIRAARRKAGVPKSTVAYTIRHSVITDLVTGGLDLFTVAKLAGTSVLMIEKHYGHLQREHARSAMKGLSLI